MILGEPRFAAKEEGETALGLDEEEAFFPDWGTEVTIVEMLPSVLLGILDAGVADSPRSEQMENGREAKNSSAQIGSTG